MRQLPEQRCVCLIHQSGQAWGALESIDRNLEHLPPLGKRVKKKNWLRKWKGRLCYPALSSPRARADVRAAIRDVPVTHRFPRRG